MLLCCYYASARPKTATVKYIWQHPLRQETNRIKLIVNSRFCKVLQWLLPGSLTLLHTILTSTLMAIWIYLYICIQLSIINSKDICIFNMILYIFIFFYNRDIFYLSIEGKYSVLR